MWCLRWVNDGLDVGVGKRWQAAVCAGGAGVG